MISRFAATIASVSCAMWVVVPALAEEAASFDTIASLDGTTIDVQESRNFVDSADKARDNYRAYLDLASDDPILQAQAIRRLGDLELELSEALMLAQNIDAIGPEAQQNAVSLFQLLLDKHPDFERNDSVMYQLARAHEIAGSTDDALRVLDELVERYPDARHIDEVQFRRGETLFLHKDYVSAENAYSYVTGIGESSRFYEQSLYKLGWSRFKLGWYQESLSPFFDLLDHKLRGIESMDDDSRLAGLSLAERELIADTLRVVSISFSYLDGATSLSSLLDSRRKTQYNHVFYINLGDLYLEKERFQDAAETYEAFVERYPYHPKSPVLQVEVIEAYKQGNFPTRVLESKKRYVESFGLDSTFWQHYSRADDANVEAHLKENLADLAQYYHANGQAENEPASFLAAAHWYRKRLSFFPDDVENAHVEFLLGEALYQSGDHLAAIGPFERAAYRHPRQNGAAEAAYAAVLSYREHAAALEGDAGSEWHQRYLDSGLRFGDSFPDHPQSAAVLTTVAEELFQQDKFDLALAVGQSVVDRVPSVDPALARTSWAVIAHSHFDLEDYAEAERAYFELRSLIPPDDLVTRQEIGDRIASSIYKQGEQARKAGDLDTAVAHFRRLGKAVPGSEIREIAEYDAAAALITAESWDRAAVVLEEFRRDFPNSEFDDLGQKLAVVYVQSGHLNAAAHEFVRIANEPSAADTVKRDALWRASDLFRDVGAAGEESAILQTIVDRYPEPIDESVEARFRLLELAEEAGDTSLKTQILNDLVYVDANAGAQRSDRTRYLAARASLELAEPVRRSFAGMKITQPLAISMQVKKSLMEEVLQVYGDAAAYGIAEVTTAATFRLGEVYLQFSQDLLESERPVGLDELALEQYELLLEEQIFPFEEKAIELFEANAARTVAGIWDEWVQRSFDELATLMPARYAKMEKSEDVVTELY